MPLRILGEDLRMAYMDVAPTAESNGQAVVLLHGLNFFGEYWGGTMDALRAQGFRVLAVDQVGFGRSSKPLLPYSLGHHAANTRDLLDHLGIDRAAIVGHSFGGMLATRFALVYPDVTTHLVLVNQIGLEDQRLDRPWRRTEDVYRDELERDYAFIRGTFEDYYVDWRPEFERHVRVHHGWTQSPDWPRLAMIRAHNRQVVYFGAGRVRLASHPGPHPRDRRRGRRAGLPRPGPGVRRGDSRCATRPVPGGRTQSTPGGAGAVQCSAGGVPARWVGFASPFAFLPAITPTGPDNMMAAVTASMA
jgi:pimeloyl-ACP methyl ester carboxylesterase